MRRSSTTIPTLAIFAVVAATALILLWMGRVPICRCGVVKLWHGTVVSAEGSQHITDWYTFSHVIHGFVFYAVLWLVARRVPVLWRLLAAVLLEAGWEIAENTEAVINRYRSATIALDYFGDSILNSLSDIAAMILGFLLAWRLPVAVTIALAIAAELIVGLLIRDNLTLNIIMLLHPLDWIKQWQAGA